MPRLQVFVVCRDVITSQEENVPTLLSIIDGFIISAPAGYESDENTAFPVSWAIFSSWKKAQGDEGRRFEQRLRIKLPNGEYEVDGPSAQFDFPPPRKTVRITHRSTGFPVRPGTYSLELQVREQGAGDWLLAAEYLIDVELRHDSAPSS